MTAVGSVAEARPDVAGWLRLSGRPNEPGMVQLYK
jgi:hypothetical protein